MAEVTKMLGKNGCRADLCRYGCCTSFIERFNAVKLRRRQRVREKRAWKKEI
jgi:hypothetical protein